MCAKKEQEPKFVGICKECGKMLTTADSYHETWSYSWHRYYCWGKCWEQKEADNHSAWKD